MSMTRICGICGTVFSTENGKAKYCSDKCRKEAARQRQARFRAENPDYQKEYRKNNAVREKFNERHPNYDRDRWRGIRGSQEYTKNCIVCGKEFTTWLPQKKTCSEECKKINRNITHRASDRKRPKRSHSPEYQHERWIIRRYGSHENYQKWLAEQESAKQELRQKREQEQLAKRKAYEKQLEDLRIAREARKEANHRIGTCVVCGNSFDTYNPAQKTCSKECGKRLKHAHKHKRIPKKQLVDKDITLEALYRRDSGVCYLCGKPCDWNDKDGNVVGSNYPSIDHMIPISRGGLHAWTNVKLAHFECNWKKSDDLPPSFSSTG